MACEIGGKLCSIGGGGFFEVVLENAMWDGGVDGKRIPAAR